MMTGRDDDYEMTMGPNERSPYWDLMNQQSVAVAQPIGDTGMHHAVFSDGTSGVVDDDGQVLHPTTVAAMLASHRRRRASKTPAHPMVEVTLPNHTHARVPYAPPLPSLPPPTKPLDPRQYRWRPLHDPKSQDR